MGCLNSMVKMAVKVEVLSELPKSRKFGDQFSLLNNFKKVLDAQNWETFIWKPLTQGKSIKLVFSQLIQFCW